MPRFLFLLDVLRSLIVRGAIVVASGLCSKLLRAEQAQISAEYAALARVCFRLLLTASMLSAKRRSRIGANCTRCRSVGKVEVSRAQW